MKNKIVGGGGGSVELVSSNGLSRIWKNVIDKFEPKEEGKVLSSNDFTNENKSSLNAMNDKISLSVNNAYKVKGSIEFSNIPTTNNTIGDVYNITDSFTTNDTFVPTERNITYHPNTNIVYTSEGWDVLGGIYDFSSYMMKEDIKPIDVGSSLIVKEEIVANSNCTEDGSKTIYYANGTIDTSIIPALGHDYIYEDEIITKNTCEKDGSKYTKKCNRCGIKTGITIISKLGGSHNWEDTSCTRCGEELIELPLTEEVSKAIGLYDIGKSGAAHMEIPGIIKYNDNYCKIVSLETGAFWYLKVTSVKIPNTVKEIKHNWSRFEHMPESIDIPDSVSLIDGSSFSLFEKLKSITFPPLITEINDQVCTNCDSLERVTFLGNVTIIGFSAFQACPKLSVITLPNSLKTIGPYAFNNDSNLNLVVPNTVTTIGKDAFKNVPHITYHGSATGAPWGALSMN